MNISLTPELEALIQNKVRSGLYNNQSEVVREALRLLAEQDDLRRVHLERLRAALAVGLEQAERGELVDGPRAMAETRTWLSERGASRKDS